MFRQALLVRIEIFTQILKSATSPFDYREDMSTPMEVDPPAPKTASSKQDKPRFEVKKVLSILNSLVENLAYM